MLKKEAFDATTYLILWQVSLTGDSSFAKFSTTADDKQQLVDMLLNAYPDNHLITLYECAVLPIDLTRIEKIELKDLANANISGKTTVVIPPVE
ncbi:MAG: hypothetical protein JKY19_04080 [Alcanivoracaceae bacterium]|nr:hypothetical protein [Alcanivoracaceae bacterium]